MLPAAQSDIGGLRQAPTAVLGCRSMSYNMLSGSLPGQWGAAGASGGMSQLNSFFLAGNQLAGSLPAWDQSGLQQLNILDLSHNALTG